MASWFLFWHILAVLTWLNAAQWGEEKQCVAEVHFERLPFRFFGLLRGRVAHGSHDSEESLPGNDSFAYFVWKVAAFLCFFFWVNEFLTLLVLGHAQIRSCRVLAKLKASGSHIWRGSGKGLPHETRMEQELLLINFVIGPFHWQLLLLINVVNHY